MPSAPERHFIRTKRFLDVLRNAYASTRARPLCILACVHMPWSYSVVLDTDLVERHGASSGIAWKAVVDSPSTMLDYSVEFEFGLLRLDLMGRMEHEDLYSFKRHPNNFCQVFQKAILGDNMLDSRRNWHLTEWGYAVRTQFIWTHNGLSIFYFEENVCESQFR